jgi:hypothetical protein
MRTNARRPSRVGPLAERPEVTNETIWGRFCDDPSTFDLFAIVKQIVDAKAQFQSLAEPWADTGTGARSAARPDAAVAMSGHWQ